MRITAAVLALAALALAGCAPTGGSTTRAEPSDEVTVYVLGVGPQPQLHAQSVEVAGTATVEKAVEVLGTYTPPKPFQTLWAGSCALGEHVDAVTVTEDLITVHYRDDAGAQCDLDERGLQLRRQQLAWTVRTATGSPAPVRVTTGADAYRAEAAVVADEKYLAPSQ